MKILKRLTLIITVLLIITLSMGCAGAARPVQREAGRVYELVLLHTNDHHGTVLPQNGRGGLAERASFVNSVRASHNNVLLLDAGDFNTGSALSNMFAAEVDILAYNLLGYDIMAIGNHEFTRTIERLESQIEIAGFPFFSSNVKTLKGEFLGGHPYIVKNYEGFRVGIFSITTLRTLSMAGQGHSLFENLSFIQEIDAAREAVALLRGRERVDIVIALTHMGDVRESIDHITSIDLAEAVQGIDIIVDGHSHSFFEAAKRIGDTWIVTAGERGMHVGQGILSIVDGGIVNFNWYPVEIVFAPDPEVTVLLAPYIAKAEASLWEIVGEAADTFIFGNRLPRYQESSLGNMIADSFVWYFQTVYKLDIDFALHNSGGIRAELPRGPLTREQILTVLTFDNYLYLVSLRGSEIIELFDYIATIPQGSGAFPVFSGEVRYTLDVPDRKIIDLTIGGAAVDPERIYRFCTNDYLLSGGDGYAFLTRAQEPFNTSQLLSYIVIEYIASRGGIISPYTDGRLTIIGGVRP